MAASSSRFWLVLGGIAALAAASASPSSTTPQPVKPVPPPPPVPVDGASVVPGGTVDLVISAYALNARTWQAAWPDAATRPQLLEWSGTSATPGGHPSWETSARALRGSDGSLLTPLLRRSNIRSAGRIAVVGFSAGANSGLRELLRSPGDRARIDSVFSIDGIHALVRDDTAKHPAAWSDPTQVDGLLSMMHAAETGGRLTVVTSSNVARPVTCSTCAKTSWALGRLTAWVAELIGRLPSSVETFSAVSDPIDPALLARLQALGETEHAKFGDMWALWFRGDQAADHIRQAHEILPLLIRLLLVPRWTRSAPLTI